MITQHEVELLGEVEKKVDLKIEVYKKFEEEVVLKEMNKLDKLKRKLKIKFMINGKDDKFQKIKKSKLAFQESIKEKKNE